MQSPQALLVIDMQLVAFDGQITPPIPDGPRLLSKVVELISNCREKHIPVIYLQTCAIDGNPYSKGAHGWEIHPDLSPKPEDQVVCKVNSSGFDETNLQKVLAALNIKALITCGIWSEYCVANTSMDAIKLGFDVCLAEDAHSTVADSLEAVQHIVMQQNNFLRQNQANISSVSQIKATLL